MWRCKCIDDRDGPRVEGERDRERGREGGKSFYLAAAAASPNFLSRGDTLARVAKHTRTHAHTPVPGRGKRPFFNDIHAFGGIH